MSIYNSMLSMKEHRFCLCASRHEMPCNDSIFENTIENPMDFDGLYAVVASKLEFVESGDHVYVYVTGLTAAMLAVVKYCADNDIFLTAMHYDRLSGEYRAQDLF